MGATKIPDATNEKILTLVTMGMTLAKTAEACGVSDSYCGKLVEVTRCIANDDWNALIACSKARTTGNVQKWACKYLNKQIPAHVLDEIERVQYSPNKKPEPPVEPPAESIDNTATAIIKLLEKLDATVSAIADAADDICSTVATARKLNEDCMNANFDALTATVRDGVESVKTTIRKGQK